MASAALQARISHLHRADGSATYSHHGYTVIAAVNGPVETSRRDELPEEAAIEVNIRPAIGVGSPKERNLESLIQSTLRNIILTRTFPRTLIQLTLQILSSPETDGRTGSMAASTLPILPALLQASMLALLSASIPLSTTLTSTLIAIDPSGEIIFAPSRKDIASAQSLHVCGFSLQRELLLAESEGDFEFAEWDQACQAAEARCSISPAPDADGGMEVDVQDDNVGALLRQVATEKVKQEMKWKSDG